ncbi:MAG: hypothetical protein M3Q07_26030 [Pseudobdellovibrionaceae bacterium]|nr:hypothetical protein [Pseudobdellovibrionaceae bacterium]
MLKLVRCVPALLLCLGSPILWGAEKVLVLGSNSSAMQEVKEAITRDLKSYQLENFIVKADTSYEDYKGELLKQKPRAVLLLDNKSVQLMQQIHQDKDPFLAGLKGSATMALNLKHILADDKLISGIAYEVPAFSILTKFRSLIDTKVSRVLVIYRKSQFQKVFQEAQVQLEREGVQLVGLDAEKDGDTPAAIQAFIDRNLKEDQSDGKVDAVLVLTDNKLLNADTFGSLWVARAQSMKIPFLCGIENFVSSKLRFCTFAAFPDHSDLAHQVSEQITAIIEDGVSPGELGVDYLIALKMAADKTILDRLGLKLREANSQDLKMID